MTETFGKDLKALRKKLGLSQFDMAVEMCVDFGTISRWELGKQRPRKLAIRQLARLAKKVKHD